MKKIDWVKVGKSVAAVSVLVIAIIVILCAIVALMVSKEVADIAVGATVAKACAILLVTAGCFITAKRSKNGKLIVSMITAISIFALLVVMKGVLFFDHKMQIGRCLISIVICALVGGVLASGKKKIR